MALQHDAALTYNALTDGAVTGYTGRRGTPMQKVCGTPMQKVGVFSLPLSCYNYR